MFQVSASTVRLKLDRVAIRTAAIRDSDRSAHHAARITRNRARAAARRRGLIQSGRGIESITYERKGEPSLRTTYHVWPTEWYMRLQEVGYPHRIYPKRARALRFKPKGSSVFIFAAYTRGVPAQHFMREARNAITPEDFVPPG